MLAGICWSAYAARQFAEDYVQHPWAEVRIPQETWQQAMACDRYFYASFYQRLEEALRSRVSSQRS